MTQTSFFTKNRGSLITLALLILLPFIVGLFDGASPVAVWNNLSGNSKFIEGLAIEIFILALYALSYDLIFGITGLLSFGHSMFFAVGAYLTGIAIKSFDINPACGICYCICCSDRTGLIVWIGIAARKGNYLCVSHAWYRIRISYRHYVERIGKIYRCGCWITGCDRA